MSLFDPFTIFIFRTNDSSPLLKQVVIQATSAMDQLSHSTSILTTQVEQDRLSPVPPQTQRTPCLVDTSCRMSPSTDNKVSPINSYNDIKTDTDIVITDNKLSELHSVTSVDHAGYQRTVSSPERRVIRPNVGVRAQQSCPETLMPPVRRAPPISKQRTPPPIPARRKPPPPV